MDELEEDIEYSIEIKPIKSKRSIQQNRLMWELLHELEKKTREPAFDWYVKAIQSTGAKATYVVAPKGSRDVLLHSYRAVKAICKRMIVNPETEKETEGIMYACYEGSSKFSVTEMNELIETVLMFCAELEIETELIR